MDWQSRRCCDTIIPTVIVADHNSPQVPVIRWFSSRTSTTLATMQASSGIPLWTVSV